MHHQPSRPLANRLARAALLLGLAAFALPTARAVQFTLGEIKGTFDTTVSIGGLYRLQEPSPAFYGTSNTFNGVAGLQNSINTDDGNLNYGKGWVSNLFKANHDLELKYRNLGAFVRGYYFTDNKATHTRRAPLSQQADDRVGTGAELLDAYVLAKFTAADMPVDVRFGRQVLSLGESTFIPNGVNVINPVDLSKLRAPGTELKEAFLPVTMLKASIGVTKNFTIEPFWLLEFRRNELEPAGTFFSTNDFATRGGQQVWLGFGTIAEGSPFGGIPRDKDREGGNYGQYGIAARLQAPALNNTEFGFYYAHYSSRSPLISARTPTTPINTDLTGPLTIAFVRGGLPPATAAAQAAAVFTAIVKNALAPATLTPLEIATLQSPAVQGAIAGAQSIALLQAAGTGRYFTQYPEDINMLGASFNTSIGSTGISWQGEITHKADVPLQLDDVELLFATLSSLNSRYGPINQIGNFLGKLNTEIPGFRRHSVWTAQTSLTKVFGPTLGAQQLSVVGEFGGVWANLPAKSTLRYDGPGTFASAVGANMIAGGFPTIPATPESAFADKFSCGYQLLAKLDYNSAFAGVNMSPTIAFTHDVKGTTPLPLGNYIANRKSVNLSVEFTYQNAWSLELRYVNFFGASRFNLLADRDYVSTTLKYSF